MVRSFFYLVLGLVLNNDESFLYLDDLEHFVDLLTKDIEIPKGDSTGKFIVSLIPKCAKYLYAAQR